MWNPRTDKTLKEPESVLEGDDASCAFLTAPIWGPFRPPSAARPPLPPVDVTTTPARPHTPTSTDGSGWAQAPPSRESRRQNLTGPVWERTSTLVSRVTPRQHNHDGRHHGLGGRARWPGWWGWPPRSLHILPKGRTPLCSFTRPPAHPALTLIVVSPRQRPRHAWVPATVGVSAPSLSDLQASRPKDATTMTGNSSGNPALLVKAATVIAFSLGHDQAFPGRLGPEGHAQGVVFSGRF